MGLWLRAIFLGISDEASVIPGSLGLLPSASLSGIPDGMGKCNGIYEPIHGILWPFTFVCPKPPFTGADPLMNL